MNNQENYEFALLYCRVSSQRQVREGDGLRSQSTSARHFVERNGWKLERTFYEKGITGGNDFRKRPELLRLLEHLDKHPEKNYVVVVDDIKRWARATMFHLELKKELAKRKAILASPNLPFILDDSPESRFFETQLAAQAQLELEQNKRQANTRMRSRLENGFWVFAAPPGYEYRTVKYQGRVLFAKKEAKIIQKALKGFASRRLLTQRDVLHFLKERGFRDGKVSYDMVRRMLSQILYAGYLEYTPWGIPLTKAIHQPLISLKEYYRIQELRKQPLNPRKTDDSDFPLRRKVNCAICGKTMIGSYFRGKTKKHPLYTCLNTECAAKPKYIQKAQIEGAFEELLVRIKPSKEILEGFELMMQKLWKGYERRCSRNQSNKRREATLMDDKIRKLVDKALTTENKTLEKCYEAEITQLEKDLALLNESLAKQKVPDFERGLGELLSVCEDPLEHWGKVDVSGKNELFRMIFEGRLEYSQTEGFRTPKIARTYAVIEQYSDIGSLMVGQGKKNLNTGQDIGDEEFLQAIGILEEWGEAFG